MGQTLGTDAWPPWPDASPNTWAKRSAPEQLTIESAQSLKGVASENPAPDQDTLVTP
ncbi:hypothetical protein KL86DES1_21349 [uncultured Desulfovibrio sp.]|uniref:Uncharacterized protein n=1 Tax=uncultured Desulfovibrio sp. TaxID=167968 RepID=A0A212L7H0_9BACT|nr:hypothetical protein KL86DES1_21349 [uncultured Desulfovibrio sp.]VZH34248.1 conserved protein of unknown function [Desulfovibrio sp. 86]